jgi:DNA-binding NarL/FixJ family response regulator
MVTGTEPLGALLVHTSPLLEALGARTRFQAALLASERGWVG